MEENQNQNQNQNQGQDGHIINNSSSPRSERSEPVRSRWTPKPEQILILESIFNSGMVNPPKDETVRIRKLLEKFGSVGDANVFYWFQNRRSRSRRRQRQMQASLAEEQQRNIIHHQQQQQAQQSSNNIQYDPLLSNSIGGGGGGFLNPDSSSPCSNSSVSVSVSVSVSPSSYLVGPGPSSSSSNNNNNNNIGHHHHHDQDGGVAAADNLFSNIPLQMGFNEIEPISSILCSSDTSNLHYQTGFITVFINGVPTEVPRGLLDIKAMFGQDVLLVHSSGVPVPTNEFGFLIQSLQHGESYFLVSRQI